MAAGRLSTSTSINRATNVCCNTSAKQITICYKWTIHNFRLISKTFGKEYDSPTFFDNANDKFKWFLEIGRDDPEEEKSEYISLYLYLNESNTLEASAAVRFFIINSKREETTEYKFEKVFGKTSPAWGKEEYIKKDFLLNEANGLLPENKLTIMCEVCFVSDIINVCGQSKSCPEKIVESKVLQDFGKLFEDPKFSDVTFVVSNHEFKAHKAVLATRSAVFAAMFEHDFEEAKANRVVVTDFDPEVFMEVLYFIYNDSAPNLYKMARNLFVAADKYALDKLRAMSEEALCADLSIEGAMETLMLADRHCAEHLKAHTKDFIKTHIEDIMETESWKTTTNLK